MFMVCYYVIALGTTLLLGLVVELKTVCAWCGFSCGLAAVGVCYVFKYKSLDLAKVVEQLHLTVT